MSERTQLIGIAAAFMLLLVVLELVRRRRLRVGYSLTWLVVGVAAITLIAVPVLVSFLAGALGIASPRSLLFAAGIGFVLWILLDHSMTLTMLWRQDKGMVQEFALLEWRVRELRDQVDELSVAQHSHGAREWAMPEAGRQSPERSEEGQPSAETLSSLGRPQALVPLTSVPAAKRSGMENGIHEPQA